MSLTGKELTLKGPITQKFVWFSCMLKCFRSLYDKQSGPRSDCSYRSSILKLVSNVRQLFAADDFSRHHLSDAFFSWRYNGLVMFLFSASVCDNVFSVYAVCRRNSWICICRGGK